MCGKMAPATRCFGPDDRFLSKEEYACDDKEREGRGKPVGKHQIEGLGEDSKGDEEPSAWCYYAPTAGH